MQYTARWGPKGFIVTAKKVVPLMDLKSTVSVKAETQADSSGTSKTYYKGLELQTVSLSTIYLRAAGVDPRAQIKEWESLVGKSYPLYIEGKRFGPAKMMLKSVSSSDVLTTNSGKFLQAKVALSFEEYSEESAATVTQTPAASTSTSSNSSGSNSSGSNSSSGNTSSAQKAAEAYAATVAKKNALATGASKSDKAVKKTVREAMLK